MCNTDDAHGKTTWRRRRPSYGEVTQKTKKSKKSVFVGGGREDFTGGGEKSEKTTFPRRRRARKPGFEPNFDDFFRSKDV